MMYARDYRRIGRESLRGFWPTAVLAGFVSGLLGCSMYGASWINLSYFTQDTSYMSSTGTYDPYAAAEYDNEVMERFVQSDFFMPMMAFLGTLLVILLIYAVVCIIIGGAVTLGYAQFNLNLVDGNQARVGDIFSNMSRIGAGFCMWFWRGLFITLWSLLLFIPGIIATYSYALVPYIMAEHPELRARDALRESKIMMKGYKWRLFCLEFSFFGWSLLISFGFVFLMATSILTGNLAGLSLGVILLLVGLLILNPYIEASRAAFYREISEQRYSNPQPEAQWREIPEEPAGEETNDYHNNDIF